jgi:hypothetical protein
MATTTSITTTYAGEFAGKYVSAALLSSSTIENGGVEVKPNVKYKEVIKKLSTDDLVKDASCDFTATSTITTVERILQPKELQVKVQLCKADFRSDWEAISMGLSAFDNLPPTFQDYLLGHIAAKAAEKNETNIWQGDKSNSGEFDGFVTKLTVDADLPAAQEIAGTTVDSSNVIAELGKIVDAIPAALYGKEDLYIYVSQNIYRAYVRALGGFAANGQGANGVNGQGTNQSLGDLLFDGVKVFVANGLPNNTAIAAEKSNLFFGTGLLSDHQEVKVIDMGDIDGSDNVRIVMKFTAGVEYAVVEDIVTYGITNAAN